MLQHNQYRINYGNICKNTSRVDHDYQVGDKFVLRNIAAENTKLHIRDPTT